MNDFKKSLYTGTLHLNKDAVPKHCIHYNSSHAVNAFGGLLI